MPNHCFSLKRLLIFVFVVLAFSLLIFFNIHPFLSPHKPAAGAKILVVDAWLSDKELDEAVEVFRAGNYSRVFVPGSPLERSLFFPGMKGSGEVTAVVLVYKGIPYDKVTPLFVKPVQKDRTYQAALKTRNWLNENNISPSAINLFTSSAHARRSWMLYRKAFENDREVGIISARPVCYNAKRWWKSSNGFRSVADETIAYIYALLFFHPDL